MDPILASVLIAIIPPLITTIGSVLIEYIKYKIKMDEESKKNKGRILNPYEKSSYKKSTIKFRPFSKYFLPITGSVFILALITAVILYLNGFNIIDPTPTPTVTSTPTIQPSDTPIPTATISPTEAPVSYRIILTCPEKTQKLYLDASEESWRYWIAGTVVPEDIPDNYSINILYQRFGTGSTDWMFAYGKGNKPEIDGSFIVDGWIGDKDNMPLEGERLAIKIALVDNTLAEAMDTLPIQTLGDLQALAISEETVYEITLQGDGYYCR